MFGVQQRENGQHRSLKWQHEWYMEAWHMMFGPHSALLFSVLFQEDGNNLTLT